MTVTINYRAKMTWTDQKTAEFKYKVPCNVTHEVELKDDGTWATISLEWQEVV